MCHYDDIVQYMSSDVFVMFLLTCTFDTSCQTFDAYFSFKLIMFIVFLCNIFPIFCVDLVVVAWLLLYTYTRVDIMAGSQNFLLIYSFSIS